MTEFIPIGRISFMLFSDDSINFSASFPVHFCIFPSAYEKSAAFSMRNWEIFLPVSIFFALLLNFFKRKIRFFQHEFPLRMNHFSFSRGVFSDFFPSIRQWFSCFRDIFSPFRIFSARTRRARTCTRVIIYWVPLPASFSLFRKICRKTYLKHSDLWIFLQKFWKKVFVKVGESEKVRNFAPAFERERRWRDDNLKGKEAGSTVLRRSKYLTLTALRERERQPDEVSFRRQKNFLKKNFRKSLVVSKEAPNFANAFDNKRKPRKRK